MRKSGIIVNIVFSSIFIALWFSLAVTYFVWSTVWYNDLIFYIGIGVLFSLLMIVAIVTLVFSIEYLVYDRKNKSIGLGWRNMNASILGFFFGLFIGSILMLIGYENEKEKMKEGSINSINSKNSKNITNDMKDNNKLKLDTNSKINLNNNNKKENINFTSRQVNNLSKLKKENDKLEEELLELRKK